MLQKSSMDWLNAVRQIGFCYLFFLTCMINRVSQSEIDDLMGKKVFERPEDLQRALASDAYKMDEVVCVNDTWCRLTAPTTTDSTDSYIFWTKESADDDTPTWEKVVSNVFHCTQPASAASNSLVRLYTTFQPFPKCLIRNATATPKTN